MSPLLLCCRLMSRSSRSASSGSERSRATSSPPSRTPYRLTEAAPIEVELLIVTRQLQTAPLAQVDDPARDQHHSRLASLAI